MKYFAGIGNRKTPEKYRDWVRQITQFLIGIGYHLRTGGADGMDEFFETSCRELNSENIELWLPWYGFNNRTDSYAKRHMRLPTLAHIDVVNKHHPAARFLSQGEVKLHARNVGQIYGDLTARSASDFVICYTPDGAESLSQLSKASGGTGMAIRLACIGKIPVINLMNDETLESAMKRIYAVLENFEPGGI